MTTGMRRRDVANVTVPLPLARPRGARVAKLRFPVLVVAGLVVAHDSIFVADAGLAGFVGTLTRTGHGGLWLLVSTIALAGAALLCSLAVVRIACLRRELRSHVGSLKMLRSNVRESADGGSAYRAELSHLWPRLFCAILAAFLLQENLEAISEAGRAVGLDPILTTHPLAIPILVALTLVMAALGALVRHETQALERSVRVLRPGPRDQGAPLRAGRPRAMALVVRESIRLHLEAGRAPPLQGCFISA